MTTVIPDPRPSRSPSELPAPVPRSAVPRVRGALVLAAAALPAALAVGAHAVAPLLLQRAPLLLLVLHPFAPFSVLVATRLDPAVFLAVAVAARALPRYGAYAAGRLHGPRAVAWARRRSARGGAGGSGGGLAARVLARSGDAALLLVNSTAVTVLAGATGMSLRRFTVLNLAGAVLAGTAALALAEVAAGPLATVVAAADRWAWPLTAAFALATAVMLTRHHLPAGLARRHLPAGLARRHLPVGPAAPDGPAVTAGTAVPAGGSARRRPRAVAWRVASALLLLVAAAVPPLAVGAVRGQAALAGLYPAPPAGPAGLAPADAADGRPTAVVVLDHAGSEVSDVLLPYQLLAASGAYRVLAVAPEARPVALLGGLDLVPQATLDGLDRAPDLVVVPAMAGPDPRVVDRIRGWHAQGATILSICTGADVVAATGLLEGRAATAHWGDLARLEAEHPDVRWVRGRRWVDGGDIVSTAGITAGVDGTLRVLDREAGRAAARRAAGAIGYADLRFLDDPAAPQHQVAAADAVYVAQALWGRRADVDIALTEGVDETALAAALDTWAATTAGTTRTVGDGPVRTRHGLTLLPDAAGPASAARVVSPPQAPSGYAPVAALTAFAAEAGRPLAAFAAKRLEYRASDLALDGPGWAATVAALAPLPLALAAAGLGTALLARRWWRARRRSAGTGPG